MRESMRDSLRAPHAANAVAFAVLFGLSAVFLFTAYCMARALIGGFGAGPRELVLCLATAFLASIFLWWLAPLTEFAEIFWIHLPADRRSRRGQCPHCGYPHGGKERCTECGRSTEPLPAWTLSRRPARRLTWIMLPALVLGCVAGECWTRADEARFAAEYAAIRAPYSRPRAFPASFARIWADECGAFRSEAWPDFARDRSWKPTDPALDERGWGWRDRGDAQPE